MRVISILLIVLSLPTGAIVIAPAGHYKVVGWLALRSRSDAELIINPATRNVYVIRIKNPKFVSKFLGQETYAGQAEVEFELRPTNDNPTVDAIAEIKAIHISDLPRIPHYDGPLVKIPEN
jgi:hypothetical protein